VPGPPFDSGTAYLLVALRPRPTRQHFDPERIEYWSRADGVSVASELVWPMSIRAETFAWGTITVVDRLAAKNRFVSFGGRLTVSRDGDVHAALLRSAAPILALGGHSGPADPLAASIGGFFAHLRAAVGTDEELRRRCDSLSAEALYGAFVARIVGCYQTPVAADTVAPRLLSMVRGERRRLETEHPSDWHAGLELGQLLMAQP
jgi:hypothetical protein